MNTITHTPDSIKFTGENGNSVVTLTHNGYEDEWIVERPGRKRAVYHQKNYTKFLDVLYDLLDEYMDEDTKQIYDFESNLSEKQWNDKDESAEKFKGTYQYLAVSIPSGRSAHVGNGIWLTRCSHCSYALTHYGSMMRYATTGDHEVEEHNGLVGGINVGLLP